MNYKPGYISKRGYRVIWVPGRGRMYEHRYVMEQHLGRTLERHEKVHHANGDRTDNRLENLTFCETERKHWDQHCGERSETHKECARCHQVKDRSEFYKRHKESPNSDDSTAYCRACYRSWYLARNTHRKHVKPI